MLTKRGFLGAGAALAGCTAATGFYTWQIEPHWLELSRHDLFVKDLPEEFAGKTMVHLSDLHIGPRVDSSYLISCLEKAASLNPDIVISTGDHVDKPHENLADVKKVLQAWPKARLLNLAVLGNHDYGDGWRDMEMAATITTHLEAAGVRVLRNEAFTYAGMKFIGLEDFWTPNFDPAAVADAISAKGPGFVLSHNPDTADEPVWQGFQGWMFSGHTHGGQCKPPFLPPPILPLRNERYAAGHFALGSARHLFVNRGVGHLLKVRFNARPEIAFFRLIAA